MAIDVETMTDEDLIAAIREVESRKTGKVDGVKAKIIEMAESVGLSVRFSTGKPARRKVAAKYRNPHNADQTWAGRGVTPQWMAELISGGAAKEDFLI